VGGNATARKEKGPQKKTSGVQRQYTRHSRQDQSGPRSSEEDAAEGASGANRTGTGDRG